MPQFIGKFETIRPLGQGGFGQVLLCKDRRPASISSLVSAMMAVTRAERPSWDAILDVLDHDREVPSWLSLKGEPGKRAREAAERRRKLISRFNREQENFYRASCNRFLCNLEDMIAEAGDHLLGPVGTSRKGSQSATFAIGDKTISCVLFERLRDECLMPVGRVLGGGYFEGGEHTANIVLCGSDNDDLHGEWWAYPTIGKPTKDQDAFYRQLAHDEGQELRFVAHASRMFSAFLHSLFLSQR